PDTGGPAAGPVEPITGASERGPRTGEPTAPVPVRVTAPPADPGEDELPTADQTPLVRRATPRAADGELPTAVLALPDRANAKPADPQSADAELADAGSVDAEPADPELSDAGSADPESAGAKPADAEPADPAPAALPDEP